MARPKSPGCPAIGGRILQNTLIVLAIVAVYRPLSGNPGKYAMVWSLRSYQTVLGANKTIVYGKIELFMA